MTSEAWLTAWVGDGTAGSRADIGTRDDTRPGAGDGPRPGDGERVARAAWSRLVEPGDVAAGALVGLLGAATALAWVRRAASGRPDWSVIAGGGDGPGAEPVICEADRRRVMAAVRRWGPRLDDVVPERDLDELARIGGALVVPGDTGWPPGLDDLGAAAPFALWCRGQAPGSDVAVALVGSRAATSYGERVAYDLAERLSGGGIRVVSGGAYGIDAAAHRGALAGGTGTVVVLAGGVDRSYPAGNARLFEGIVAEGGAVLGEMPPGSLPMRSRFLQRNRVIAAGTAACVVVEAAWRSGALSTAHHAAGLLRPVGAVPGPVTSPASAGCHRLLREGAAVCVTDADEVRELLPGEGPSQRDPGEAGPEIPAGGPAARVRDALGLRAPVPVGDLCRRAGTTEDETLSALGLLEIAGLARRRGGGWVAVRSGTP